MRYVHAKPIAFHLRTWLLAGLIVLIVGAAGCSQPAASQQVETPAAEEGFTLQAPYRSDVEVPFQPQEGLAFLSPLFEDTITEDGTISETDLEEIQLSVTVPPLPLDGQTLTDTQVLTDSYLEQMSFVLVGSAESAEIVLDLPETLSVDTFHNETVIHGFLVGTMTYENGSTAEVLLLPTIIPERQRGQFNLTINPHGNNALGVSLPFGTLEMTPELREIVRN